MDENKKIDKDKANQPIYQNCYYGNNKYINGVHGWFSVYLFCVSFPAEM